MVCGLAGKALNGPVSFSKRHKQKFWAIPDKAIILRYFSHCVVTGHYHETSVNDTAFGATALSLSSGMNHWPHDKARRGGWLLHSIVVQILMNPHDFEPPLHIWELAMLKWDKAKQT